MNIALNSLEKGLNKLEINNVKLEEDLDKSWEVLTEAIQTVIRKNNIPDGYELMKDLSRGKDITQTDLVKFINNMNVPSNEKVRLLKLTPASYIGYAADLSKT
jgi:adenylosuccinate lyase